MSASLLVDTNVLVYAYDMDELPRRARSIEVMGRLQERPGSAAVSTQTLSEYCSVMTRKFARTWKAEETARQVRGFLGVFEVIPTGVDVVLEAMRGVSRYQLAYYDAQIWAAARLSGIPVVLSEDFTDGLELEGVHFADPFSDGFDLARFV